MEQENLKANISQMLNNFPKICQLLSMKASYIYLSINQSITCLLTLLLLKTPELRQCCGSKPHFRGS